MRALCLLSYRAIRSAFDNFPCLIKFVSESARNYAGIDETCTLMLATRVRTPPNWQANVTWEEKVNGPTRPNPYGPAGLLGHMVSVLAPTGLAQPSTGLHGYSYQHGARAYTKRNSYDARTKTKYVLTAREPPAYACDHNIAKWSLHTDFQRATGPYGFQSLTGPGSPVGLI